MGKDRLQSGPLDRLRYHVNKAIERGAEPVVEQPTERLELERRVWETVQRNDMTRREVTAMLAPLVPIEVLREFLNNEGR